MIRPQDITVTQRVKDGILTLTARLDLSISSKLDYVELNREGNIDQVPLIEEDLKRAFVEQIYDGIREQTVKVADLFRETVANPMLSPYERCEQTWKILDAILSIGTEEFNISDHKIEENETTKESKTTEVPEGYIV